MVSSFGFITFQKFKNRKELILKRLFVLKMENLFREKKSDELLGKFYLDNNFICFLNSFLLKSFFYFHFSFIFVDKF